MFQRDNSASNRKIFSDGAEHSRGGWRAAVYHDARGRRGSSGDGDDVKDDDGDCDCDKKGEQFIMM